MRWVGGISAGLSPWIYAALLYVAEQVGGWNGFPGTPPVVSRLLLFLCVAVTLACLPLAFFLQTWLGRNILRQPESQGRRATNLVAAGLTSLTLVHVPAAVAILYYFFSGDLFLSLVFELASFLLYLPMQRLIEKQIKESTLNE